MIPFYPFIFVEEPKKKDDFIPLYIELDIPPQISPSKKDEQEDSTVIVIEIL